MASSLSLELYSDPWGIKKVLTDSDTSHNNMLILYGCQVEVMVLPELSEDAANDAQTDDGTEVKFWDIDTESLHELVLKRKSSYILTGNWNEDFIRRRNLNARDEIGLEWDPYNNRFNFSVLMRA
ncbi:putative B3 domain-containing protein At1g78640 [Prosopis cineraria]|uniref:putative B3 domain-containing protein At1g78640 n=1 Tax=Prosopis cineraria TaxID=364024 RepID=UPI00240F77F1|nr:putative B3 domain-containing protein At1g78640 [Prosopis cineraria]